MDLIEIRKITNPFGRFVYDLNLTVRGASIFVCSMGIKKEKADNFANELSSYIGKKIVYTEMSTEEIKQKKIIPAGNARQLYEVTVYDNAIKIGQEIIDWSDIVSIYDEPAKNNVSTLIIRLKDYREISAKVDDINKFKMYLKDVDKEFLFDSESMNE